MTELLEVIKSIINQPVFWPAIAVVVAFPVLLVVCTELARFFDARGSSVAKAIRLVRNFALPLAALLILLFQLDGLEPQYTWPRLTATALGFVLILVVINLLNLAIFASAEHGSWRERMPSIFVDIIKLVVIVVCFAMLFQWVWGADVGGLFTALGVTSIVIGLALQQAAGSVVSGLLLLFEQPFKLGDWLDTDSVRGRVVEVNWRAVHIDIGNGTRVVPTSTLASASFTNLSRSSECFWAQTTVQFANIDAPSAVIETILGSTMELPLRLPEPPVRVIPRGAGTFDVMIPVAQPADEGRIIPILLGWLWFSARRAGLHLDGETGDSMDLANLQSAAVENLIKQFVLNDESAQRLRDSAYVERFGSGETLTSAGTPVTSLRYILKGEVLLSVRENNQSFLYATLSAPEPVGLGAYSHQPEPDSATAASTVIALTIPRDVVEETFDRAPRLAADIGRLVDSRTELLKSKTQRGFDAIVTRE